MAEISKDWRELRSDGKGGLEEVPRKVIDNDFHPADKGLNAAQEDHWGTKIGRALDAMRRGVQPRGK